MTWDMQRTRLRVAHRLGLSCFLISLATGCDLLNQSADTDSDPMSGMDSSPSDEGRDEPMDEGRDEPMDEGDAESGGTSEGGDEPSPPPCEYEIRACFERAELGEVDAWVCEELERMCASGMDDPLPQGCAATVTECFESAFAGGEDFAVCEQLAVDCFGETMDPHQPIDCDAAAHACDERADAGEGDARACEDIAAQCAIGDCFAEVDDCLVRALSDEDFRACEQIASDCAHNACQSSVDRCYGWADSSGDQAACEAIAGQCEEGDCMSTAALCYDWAHNEEEAWICQQLELVCSNMPMDPRPYDCDSLGQCYYDVSLELVDESVCNRIALECEPIDLPVDCNLAVEECFAHAEPHSPAFMICEQMAAECNR